MKDLMYKSVVLASSFLAPVSNLFADQDISYAILLPIRTELTANDTIQQFPDLSVVRGRIEAELLAVAAMRAMKKIEIEDAHAVRKLFSPMYAALASYVYLRLIPQWEEWGFFKKAAAMGSSTVVVAGVLAGIARYVVDPIFARDLRVLSERIDALAELMKVCMYIEAQPLSSLVHQEKYVQDLVEVYAMCMLQSDRSILDVRLESGQSIKDRMRELALFPTQYVLPQAYEDSE